MRKKIVGIFVMTLLIASAIPSLGRIDELKPTNIDKVNIYQDFEFVPGEFIVKFKESPISSLSIDNLNEKYKVSSMERVFRNAENTPLENIYILSVPDDTDVLSIILDYASYPDVIYAEPNGIAYPCYIPNDERYEQQRDNLELVKCDKALDDDIAH